MLNFSFLAGGIHLFLYHIILFSVILCCWKYSQELGFLAVILLVFYCRLLSDSPQAGGMGCKPSTIEPLVCEKDIQEFLTRWQRATVDQSVSSQQSSSDYSILEIEEKSNMNRGAGGGVVTCPTNWVSEIPEVLGVALVAILAFVWIRRWNRRQYLKQYRRAMGLGIGLQTVSSTVPMQGQLTQEGSYKGWAGRSLD